MEATPKRRLTEASLQRQREHAERRDASVLRCIQETPGLSAQDIAARLGDYSDRAVRTHIRRLREAGHPITLGKETRGYVDLETVDDERTRAQFVRDHHARCEGYLRDHARLMRQVGKMTATEMAQMALFSILIEPLAGEEIEDRPLSMRDVARLPVERRSGLTKLLCALLDGLEQDREAFAAERAVIASRYKRVFLTGDEASKLAQARALLAEIGV